MLTLKALEGLKIIIAYQLLLSSVTTMSIFEKQLIKLPVRENSFRKLVFNVHAESHGHYERGRVF